MRIAYSLLLHKVLPKGPNNPCMTEDPRHPYFCLGKRITYSFILHKVIPEGAMYPYMNKDRLYPYPCLSMRTTYSVVLHKVLHKDEPRTSSSSPLH